MAAPDEAAQPDDMLTRDPMVVLRRRARPEFLARNGNFIVVRDRIRQVLVEEVDRVKMNEATTEERTPAPADKQVSETRCSASSAEAFTQGVQRNGPDRQRTPA
jgi:hypothetical protein